MTTRLSIDDQPHQDQAPVNGAAEGRGRWVRQARIDRGQAATGDHGLLTSEERAEPHRLRKENREIRRVKDFFRLAAAHFARERLSPKGFA